MRQRRALEGVGVDLGRGRILSILLLNTVNSCVMTDEDGLKGEETGMTGVIKRKAEKGDIRREERNIGIEIKDKNEAVKAYDGTDGSMYDALRRGFRNKQRSTNV